MAQTDNLVKSGIIATLIDIIIVIGFLLVAAVNLVALLVYAHRQHNRQQQRHDR